MAAEVAGRQSKSCTISQVTTKENKGKTRGRGENKGTLAVTMDCQVLIEQRLSAILSKGIKDSILRRKALGGSRRATSSAKWRPKSRVERLYKVGLWSPGRDSRRRAASRMTFTGDEGRK